MREELISAIREHSPAFAVQLSGARLERLADYFELVVEHNRLLHLVAPCSPEEFAIRHVLESLTLLDHLPPLSRFVDIGSGAGLPALPCVLARDDLAARLVESKEKKAKFLNTAVNALGLSDRVKVINRQFAETNAGDAGFVTCRALDRFTERLPALVRWAGRRPMFFFGGNNLRGALQKEKLSVVQQLMPLSEQRFLFAVNSQRTGGSRA
jgi:16S rRNA (guanine(527)-N(7))-methyltransferase RsmG